MNNTGLPLRVFYLLICEMAQLVMRGDPGGLNSVGRLGMNSVTTLRRSLLVFMFINIIVPSKLEELKEIALSDKAAICGTGL